ncbi:magnesium/cobalt transporter CorA [bacterium]|nr:MAG: magnesium/cobalt transporter CorA [bacterium]
MARLRRWQIGEFRLRAARLNGQPPCQEIGLDEAVRAVKEPGPPVWVDIVTEDTPETRTLLTERMGLDELAVEDALSDRERPTLQEFDGMAFLVVPAAVGNGGTERFVEVGFFLNDHAMVTVSREDVPVLDGWFERWVARPGSLAKSPSYILHAVVDAIVDDYFVVIDDIEDQVEDLGDTLFAGREGRLPEIVRLKRRLMKMRRAIAPVRDVLNALLRRDLDIIPDESRRHFQDVLDHALRIGEMVDALRDSLTSMVDIHLSNVSNNLNVVLKKMTVLSTVLMTMALVSGIYGMNFAHMPELHWRYGYPFALGLMFLLGGLVLVVFKRIRWI